MSSVSRKQPADGEHAPWCSCCGWDIHEYEGLFWVEPDDFQARKQGLPVYADMAGFFVAICERCYAEELPAHPHDKSKTPCCSLCGDLTSFGDCKWVDMACFDSLAGGMGELFTDITGRLFLICPACYAADVDLYLGLQD